LTLLVKAVPKAACCILALGLALTALAGCQATRVDADRQLTDALVGVREVNASAWGVTVPGISAAVFGSGNDMVSAVSGAADPPGATSLQREDRFHIGSVTKTFTAALIMLLDQEGRLSLDDPVSKWLDYPGGETITVRMLLGHTSGVPEFTDAVGLTRQETPREAIGLAASMEPTFTPGSGWAYSNTNYTILGVVSEEAGGSTWEQQVRQRFIEPLGLESTYLWSGQPQGPTVSGSRLACGIPGEPDCKPQAGLALLPVVDGADWTLAWAAGSLVSTPQDMARWMKALVDGDVLDPEHRQLLTTPTPQSQAVLTDLPAFGSTSWVGCSLGLMNYEVDGVGSAWGHSGSINGFVANAAYFTETQASVAVTSNFAMTDSFAALGDVAAALTE